MRARQIPGFVMHINPDENLLIEGAELVNAVSILTGFPDPARWPNRSLVEHTRGRQKIAYQSLVVTAGEEYSESSSVIAHSLLLPAKAESWGQFPEVQYLLMDGKLAELGATAVHSDYQRLGLAKTILKVRQEEAKARGLSLCVAVWDEGISHEMYKNMPGWIYLGASIAIHTKKLVHRYVEFSALGDFSDS